jgi:hypothetical protein
MVCVGCEGHRLPLAGSRHAHHRIESLDCLNVTTALKCPSIDRYSCATNRQMLSTIRWTMHAHKSMCSPSQTFALVEEDIGRRIFPATVEGRKFLSGEYADLVIIEFYPLLVFLLTRQCTTCNERDVVPRIGGCAFMRDNSCMPKPQ